MTNEPRLAVESIAGRRDYQEDAVLAKQLSDGRTLVAVADGMGGHAAGEVASALALETLVRALEEGAHLDEAFVKANAEVWDKAREPGKKGMGTTLVAALIEDGEFTIANVGDSRGYLLTSSGIRQITHDHSFAAEAERHGQPIAEEMAIRYKDALTRSIGTEEHVEVDVFGPFPVKDDTALLICSDGLYKVLDDQALQRIYLESSGPRGAARSLVSSALHDGSDDNISAAIAEHGELPRTLAQGTIPMEYVPPAEDEAVGRAGTSEEEPDRDGSAKETASAPVPTAAGQSRVDTPSGGVKPGPLIAAIVVIAVLIAIAAYAL